MKVINLPTWEDFEAEVESLIDTLKKNQSEIKAFLSPLLFRGHCNASWNLETTLERYTSRQYTTKEYYWLMFAVKTAIESFTEKTWNLDRDYSKDDKITLPPPQGYDFMVYLRHHGFPSPLLDWTRSPYIAAFFAFNPINSKEDDGNAAIFSFVEYFKGGIKTSLEEEATIVGCGPYVSTHKRHFNQQSQYTYCQQKIGDKFVYCNHEAAFKRERANQDVLRKFTIPKKEREKILEKLLMMNITAFSLFGNEESLMTTLAFQEIERRKKAGN